MGTRKRRYSLDKELNERLRTNRMTDSSQVKDYFLSMAPNIITPEFIKCGSRGNFKHIYEVAEGTDFTNNTVYGLSIKSWNGEEYERNESSALCNSMAEVNKILEEL